ncbi:hypothetical protein [Mycolicibacterium alvei]|uniref:ESX-1 secretion-associated protein EspA/EspE-like domain-containing protein n=1 Tax=Mycolicibacterium alvei TaxID=67081 RepID=A0A6N4V1C8_9MYCO|nr:hypothetical protein [Mycolicibacterium alvei]MCV6998830.1 hypothetical protein [Mycolicibacterium alvei]BBX30398.1 hypothetical protein MALV_55230 [Mycolicibacterium alvei]
MDVEAIDAALAQLRRLLGSAHPPQLRATTPPAAVEDPQGWSGSARESAHDNATRLHQTRTTLHATHASVTTVVNHAQSIGPDARRAMDAVLSAWEGDKRSLQPWSGSPEVRAKLQAAGQQRLNEAGRIVQDAVQRYGQAAQQVQALSGQLPLSSGNSDSAPAGIQMVDFKQGPPIPSPTPEDGAGGEPPLGLPRYNGGTLSDAETRTVYLHGELQMRRLNEELVRRGVSAEDRARIMFEQRNKLRSWSRELMSDRQLADYLNANERNLTFDELVAKNQARGLSGDALYNAIVESSTRSRPSVNDSLGIDPDNPPPLPPVTGPIAPTGTSPPAPTAAPSPDSWGTYIPPEQLAQSDDPVLRILGQILLGQRGPDDPTYGTA